MAAPLVSISSVLICPHGGQATLIPTNPRVLLSGAPVAGIGDQVVVSGCPLPNNPCVRIVFSTGTTRALARGQPLLNITSVGNCFGANGALNGAATFTAGDPRVQGS